MHSIRASIMRGSDLKKLFTILFWLLLLAGLYISRLYNYLFFHAVVEILSIVIAFGVFMIAWNSRRFINNGYILLIGIAYFFVGCIDLIHTFAHRGMNVFTGFNTNLPSQLWITGRYLESISFLVAPLFFHRKLKPRAAFASYCIVTFSILVSIFYLKIFPDCIIEGQGSTSFKVISENIVLSVLVASIILLLRSRDKFDESLFSFVAWSIVFITGSELCFAFFGLSSLIGHYFKIVSFYFMYMAMIKTGLEKPYSLLLRDLKISEEALKRPQEELEKLVEKRTDQLRETNKQLIELSKRLGDAENVERQRISRELHDMVGQNLTALGISLNLLNYMLPPEAPDAICLRINDSIALVEETTESIRNVMTQLRPPVLDDYGLLAALRWYGEQFSSRTNISVVIEGEEAVPRLNMHIEGALFRITQEALNNVLKHARASKAIIVLTNYSGYVLLTIKDNGRGFDPGNIADDKKLGKWGLTNIMERAMSIGGQCRIESSPGKGTQITVEVVS